MTSKWRKVRLGVIAPFSEKKLPCSCITLENYVSTDSLLPNRKGRIISTVLPLIFGNIPAYEYGDILISNIRPYLKKIWLATTEGCCSTDILIFHSTDFITSQYLFYVLSQDDFFSYMMGSAKGSKMPRGDKYAIENYTFALPHDISTQQHIADILTTCDEVIAQTEKAIEKYRNIKAGMMQDLFTRGLDSNGKLRPTPESTPDLYKDSPLGKIPKEWEVTTLGDCCLTPMYGLNTAAVPYDNKHKYIRITDISEISHKFQPDLLSSPQNFSEEYKIGVGDILFARTGATVGKSYMFMPEDGEVYFAGYLICFHVTESYSTPFIFYHTQTPEYKTWVSIMSTRTGQPGVNSAEYAKFTLRIPKSKAEQQQVADRLSSLDSLITAEEQTLAKYRSIKLGLMKRLLTPPEDAVIEDET